MGVKIFEIVLPTLGVRTLKEDKFVVEMANFLADVTDLPGNIVLWTRPQPELLPHDKYRIKVFKDRIHSATLKISQDAQQLWEIPRKKYQLSEYELSLAQQVVSEYASIFIQVVDDRLSADDAKYQIKMLRGQK